MDLVRDVETYIQRYQLLAPNDALVVGVSGGPDSVALLHILHEITLSYHLTLHVAHLNHSSRGREADADEAFVVALAQDWQIPITTERIDVPAVARREGLAFEEAARRVRYGFLCRVAQQIGAHRIAVAHHGDDQAETVLMHLLRGSGPAGLRGMLPCTPMRDYRLLCQGEQVLTDLYLIRPLLSVPRDEIERYCQQQGLATRFDRSNLDTTHYRNKLRHEVIPYLREMNPQISERLRNLAEVVRADYALLREFVSVAWDTLLIATHSDALVFDLARWREQPIAIRRAIIRRSAYRLRHTLRDVDFQHVEHAAQIAQIGQTGTQAVLPHDLVVTVGYTTLTIGDAEALHLPTERPWLEPKTKVPVSVPGVTPLPNGWALHAQEVPHWDLKTVRNNPNPLVAWLDRDAFDETLILRTRQEGDRFQPQGMDGAEVRLSDFLINIKLPRRWRDRLPLLVSEERILWVTGLRLSEPARVREDSGGVIYLRFCGP